MNFGEVITTTSLQEVQLDNRAKETGWDRGLQVGGSNLDDVTLLPEGRWSQQQQQQQSLRKSLTRIQGRGTGVD